MIRPIRCSTTLIVSALACLVLATGAIAQVGKCCLPDGRGCRDVTMSQCDSFGGVFVPGQMCASPDDNCDPPLPMGACCLAAGCTFVLQSACPSGTPFFANQNCSPTICQPPVSGACCEEFACRITTTNDCPNGTFFPSQGCTPGICGTPPTGACCRLGNCETTLRFNCIDAGGEWFQEQACTVNFCRLGACCTGPFSCVIVTQSGCEQGVWISDGTCAPAFCVSGRGSCCRDNGVCVVTIPEDCTNGTFIFDGSCTPGLCTALTGACCRGTTCTAVTQADCTAAGGDFQGIEATCGDEGNPTTCCPANFNRFGGVTVQDIFDFLASYFNNDPASDFNGEGGITVQDIFDFLAAYFTGC